MAADETSLATQALANGLEAVAWPLLQCQHVVRAKEDAHLLGSELLLELRHSGDDERVRIVLLELGALMGVDEVFQCQRV